MLQRISALVVCVTLACAVFGGSTGTVVHMPQGSGAGTGNGDYVSDAAALNAPYRYFIEVPAGATKLAVELYDADVGINAGEDLLGRDRDRGGAYNTTATYSLINPAGAAVTPRFTTGTNALPAGADGAWLMFYSATGNNVLDNFGTNAYTNNNGNNNWATSWVETDGGAGGATGGSILVTGGQMRLQDVDTGQQSIYREADLLGTPGLNMSMATLTFSYTTSGNLEAADQITIEGSANGGGAWTTLGTLGGNVTGTASYDITSLIANNTRIRFTVANSEFDGNGGSEYFFIDNVQIADGAAPAAGHWELRIAQNAGGDDINAIGIAAHDGDSTSGGTEFNVYADSMVSLGVNPDGAGGNSRSYTLYPWVTSGCTCTQNDFDRDSDGGSIGQVQYTSRSGAFTQTFLTGTLSTDDSWNRDDITNYTNRNYSIDYGIWTQTSSINTYVNTSGNYETMYVGNYLAPANPPTANPITSGGFPATSRIYLPTDAGAAPVKPYLQQYLTTVGGPQPAPALGVARNYTVTITVVNPTAFPITFSATNTVVANVPGGAVTYQDASLQSQGSVTSEPAVNGSGNVVWNPGTVAAGATALLAYNITVTPAAATTSVTGTATSGNGTRATYVDETGNTTQSRATYRLGGLCELQVVVGLATEVMLSSFEADRGRVEWTTASEAGSVGFNLYREDGSKVNEGLIAAGQGHYSVDDRRAGQRYFIEEVMASGKTKRYGPLTSMRRLGPDVKASDGKRNLRIRTASAEPKFSTDAAPDKTSAVMVGVRDTGVVRVPFTELASRFGISLDRVERSASKGQYAVTLAGQPISYTTTLDSILFFGEKPASLYSSERTYRIEAAKGAMMTTQNVPPSSGSVSVVNGKIEAETDAFAATVLPLDPESDYWFWDYVVSGDPSVGRRTFTINVPDVASTSNAKLEVRLQGALAGASHGARVKLNGVPAGEISWSSLDDKTVTLTLPDGALQEGANQVEVEGVLDPSAAFDVFYVDGFVFRYQRYARPVAGAIEASVTSSVTTGPFGSEPMVLDITKRRSPVLLSGGSFAGGNVSMALPTLTKNVFVANQFVAPSSYRSATDVSYKNLKADYVIVAPASLRTGAEALASLRSAGGLRSEVVDLQPIYDAFSYGEPNPNALRAFVQELIAVNKNYPPKYIVLAGTGTFDYRGIIQAAGPIPPIMIKTNDGLYASDVKITDVNNDGTPDVAIGRIPVSNNLELLAYVDKLRDHTSAATSEPIVFSADAADGDTNFGKASDEAAQPLETRPKQRVHIGEVGPEAARASLLATWETGTPLVSWVGHGGLDQLANSGFLTAGDAPSLVSDGRLPVLVAMTCTINRFEVGGFAESLGSALTREEDGGALAVWSATGLSNHENAREMQRTFMKLAAAKPQLRLGDLIVQTLAAHNSDTAGIYVLLGDPALSLGLPKEITNGGTPEPRGE